MKLTDNTTALSSQQTEDIRSMLFAIAILMAFVFIVSFMIYLIKERYGLSCNCGTSLPFIIAILTSLGVFVGILTYYFFSRSFSREKKEIFGSIEKTLNFLDTDEKTILYALIDNDGQVAQNTLAKITKLDPVKLHRRLTTLEKKEILHKIKKGMTNKIHLNEEYLTLFRQK